MSSILEKLEKRVLPLVQKPARYSGAEMGAAAATDCPGRVRMALVYPDVYEVGMSNLGLRVLGEVASRLDGLTVERAFVPWPDAERLMREHGIPLYSLESFAPLRGFDLLGFTLQSELTYTNVLSVLDLSGIPMRSADRDDSHPLVCAGGPCTINPEPLAPFIDFFVLGDGEQALCEITRVLDRCIGEGAGKKRRLELLAELPGIYVPGESAPKEGERVEVLRVEDLDSQPVPGGLPVPLISVAQDHFPVEIMRGCTAGCRFCQAGMYYRPVRVRSPRAVIEGVRRAVRRGGWDSVTLLSLSSADYPAIDELVETLAPELGGAGVRLSFPSLRVSPRTLSLLEKLEGRRSGLTFAVEAGSERLRDVIGKKVSDDELLRMVTEAFRSGWTLVKLYFMLGLPTETDEDVDAVARLIGRVAAIGRSVPGKRNVNVTLSPFVPKPGTPFERERQEPPEIIRARIGRVRDAVKSRRVALKVNDPESSALEGALARGGRELADVIECAWRAGARFDGWGEHFSAELWHSAFEACGLQWKSFLSGFGGRDTLPWHFVGMPVSCDFLDREREHAAAGENVVDCAEGPCLDCGAAKPAVCRSARKIPAGGGAGQAEEPPLSTGGPLPEAADHPERVTWRVHYQRTGALRYLGHLDMARGLEFVLRRSGLPVCYSGGYNPRMKLHFSPPLPLGLASEAEYFDCELLPVEGGEQAVRGALEDATRGQLRGFRVAGVRETGRGAKPPPLAADIVSCAYEARIPAELVDAATESGWRALAEKRRAMRLDEGAIHWRRDKKGRRKEVDLRKALDGLEICWDNGPLLKFTLDVQGPDVCRADSFLRYLLELDEHGSRLCPVLKKRAFVFREGRPLDPMQVA